MSQSARPIYSKDQVREYLEYIGKSNLIDESNCNTEAGLKYLNELLLLHQAKVPFENLDLHYSPHHTVSIDPDVLFHKIVTRKAGRGGYCMQNNLFFATILRSLGYKVMPCGSRVSSTADGQQDPQQASYSGWSHTVSIVHIAGHKYFVDVGFGANQPSNAIPLVDGWTGRRIWNDNDDQALNWTHILDNTFQNEEQKLWVYSVRFGPDKPWLPQYCFSEVEFLPQDFFVMSYYVSHSLHSIFTYKIMVRKCLLDKEGNDVGDITLLNGIFKQRKFGKSEVLLEAKSEEERVKGLRDYLGIILDPTEVRGTRNYATMLRG